MRSAPADVGRLPSAMASAPTPFITRLRDATSEYCYESLQFRDSRFQEKTPSAITLYAGDANTRHVHGNGLTITEDARNRAWNEWNPTGFQLSTCHGTTRPHSHILTARRYASAVLAFIVCSSVHHTPVLCQNGSTHTTPHDSPRTLVFLRQRFRWKSNGATHLQRRHQMQLG